ncbi:MAG: hypothetical protein PCFJNLEI_03111 [Verrucomicrobiae bacterium]|nr:hypothetical protein [Verrucomicrobiae bacterium]
MKSFLILSLMLLVIGKLGAADNDPVKPGSLAYLDSQYGFRDLKFEQELAACPGMTLVEDSGDLKFYARPADALEQGGVKLKSIEYSFYKGKLANVMLTVAGGVDPTPLFKSLQTDYGTAQQSPNKPGKFYWFGKKVVVDYIGEGAGRGTVGMWANLCKPSKKLTARSESKSRQALTLRCRRSIACPL